MSEQLQKQMSEAEQKILVGSFMGKICPMSMGAARAPEPKSLLTPLPGQQQAQAQPEVMGCQGPACMWFRIITDEKGAVVGGECAVALLSFSISMLPKQLSDLGKLRFTPNGG